VPPESRPTLVHTDSDANSINGTRTPEPSSQLHTRRGSAPAFANIDQLQSHNEQLLAEVFRLKFALNRQSSQKQASTTASSARSAAASVEDLTLSVPDQAKFAKAKTTDSSIEQDIPVVKDSVTRYVNCNQDQKRVFLRPPIPAERDLTSVEQDVVLKDPVTTDINNKLEPERVILPQTNSVERDLILPAPLPTIGSLPGPGGDDKDGDVDLEEGVSANIASAQNDEEKIASDAAQAGTSKQQSFFASTTAKFYATYSPQVDPPLILPSAPTNKEKELYLRTNRPLLYTAGVFSFLSLTAGMWLFTISSKYFAWFGVFCGALQIYMGISYWVGLVGKDFDFKGHQKIVEEHPIDPETCPTVDIYLPCCKEPLEIIENTYKHVCELDYPKDKLKVYVLDDGDMASVATLAKQYGFEYIVRGDRPRLKKAGNLRWAFQRTQGDFFNIYDADFCPRPDILREIIPRMLADPEIAIVQTPQFFRTLDSQTWVEQGAGAIQELFYRVVQVNRDRWGASICVGSNAVYRRAALVDVGGTAEIGFSEDVHTGFGCVDRGWKVRYIPLCLACGVCPDSPRAFFSQQMRWCMGSTTLLSNPDFWTSNLTRTQKVSYLCGMMYYSAVSLSIFVNPLPGIFMVWLRPEYFRAYNLAFACPSIMYTLVTFRIWAKASYGLNVQYIQVIQSYAYLTAIKDRVFGRALMWAPSGDSKAHKNNKYRNMRTLAWCWLLVWMSALLTGMIYQILRGMHWWNCIPLLCLDTLNLWLAHRFLFCNS
jgi:cellulose synthase/poly-beta-1,6-N-acetylglucosamine synthase-like glycosyltransferase